MAPGSRAPSSGCGQVAHARRMPRGEARVVGHRLLVDGGAQQRGQSPASSSTSRWASSRPAISTGLFAASSRWRAGNGLIRRPGRCIDAGRAAEIDLRFVVQDVAGRLMKTGPVGGVNAIFAARRTMRGRSCSRATSTPLHSGCAMAPGVVQQRFLQAVADFVLPRRDDQRRAGKLRVVERAIALPSPACSAGSPRPLAGCPREAVGHRQHRRFLQAST